eukprot:1019869-Pyramimonas_sp.AAC.1
MQKEYAAAAALPEQPSRHPRNNVTASCPLRDHAGNIVLPLTSGPRDLVLTARIPAAVPSVSMGACQPAGLL